MPVNRHPPPRVAVSRMQPLLALAAFALLASIATPGRGAEPANEHRGVKPPSPVQMAGGPTPNASALPATPDAACPDLLRHTYNSLQTGQPQSLCQYAGKVVLIVNTASYCAYTGQYEGLEALYRKYRDRGLVVLGFPSNDYGSQEPGSNKEIAEFCRTTYGVEFPMFEKASSARLVASPLYAQLIAKTGQTPQWNFHKYLVDRSGKRIESFGSAVEPGQRAFVSALERLLADKPAS
jgi:glutathione peroxidase